MKKIVLCALSLLLFAGVTQAQEFKPFKLGLGIGFAKPSEGGGGILFDFEPAYRINDQIAVGLRVESAAMVKGITESSASASATGSYTLNGQYYLSNNNFRPYVGAGLGIFAMASVGADASGTGEVGGGTSFGFYPRLGFDLGHFNVNLDYNLVSATPSMVVDSNGAISEGKIKNSYLGIRIGAFIFGGRK